MDKKKFEKIIKTGGYDNSILPNDVEVLRMMKKFDAIQKSDYDALPPKDRLEVYTKQRILYFTVRKEWSQIKK